MPWTLEDVESKKKGLSLAQKKKWVRIANRVLAQCRAEKGSDCEAKAIMTANSRTKRTTKGGDNMTEQRIKSEEITTERREYFDKGESAPDPETVYVEKCIDFISKNEEKRQVTGIVLEPEKVDLQGDIYSVECIEKACDNFNSHCKQMGIMHKEFKGDLKPLQSYTVDAEKFVLNGREIKQGTWIIKAQAMNEKTWDIIKRGDITGFSVGAMITYVPIEEAA